MIHQLQALQIILAEWFNEGDCEDCDNCDCEDQPILILIPREIVVFTKPKRTMSQPRGGRTPGAGNFGKEETMHLLMIRSAL